MVIIDILYFSFFTSKYFPLIVGTWIDLWGLENIKMVHFLGTRDLFLDR